MLKWKISNFLVVAYLAHVADSVPADYCLYPLNQSDCGMKPTVVISYYKPGSRCEIEYWRGCPTFNKFDNQYDCIHLCIYRYRVNKEEAVLIPIKFTTRHEEPENIIKLKRNVNQLEANLSVLPETELSDIKEAVEILETKLHEIIKENETSSTTPEITTTVFTTAETKADTTAQIIIEATTMELTTKRIEITPAETTPSTTTPAETTITEKTTTTDTTTPEITIPPETTSSETTRAETTTELPTTDSAGYASEIELA